MKGPVRDVMAERRADEERVPWLSTWQPAAVNWRGHTTRGLRVKPRYNGEYAPPPEFGCSPPEILVRWVSDDGYRAPISLAPRLPLGPAGPPGVD